MRDRSFTAPIAVWVVGVDGTRRYDETGSAKAARDIVLELVKDYPNHWVVAKAADGTVVHRVEPKTLAGGDVPGHDRRPMPGQEAMFS